MCIALKVVAAAASIAGTAIGAYGQYRNARASSQAAQYQAQVAQNNHRISEQYAQDALDRGKQEEAAHRAKVDRIKGAQLAALAASGVDISDGTALDLLADTAEMGELDAQIIRNNAEREAYGYRVKGMNYKSEAGLLRTRADTYRSAGMLSVGSSLLSGFGQTAFSYESLKN